MPTRRYLVSGRVQGVTFRGATCETAARLGVCGWVRNLPDGRVEALGSGAVAQLQAFEAWLHAGPPHARVVEVLVSDSEEPVADGFEYR